MTNNSRKGRRARHTAAQSVSVRTPYISRNFGPLNLLEEEGLQLIERNADIILQEVGMDFRGDEEALELLHDAGAEVKGERVRFEAGMCRKIIQATAPRKYVQCARNPDNNIHVGGRNVAFSPVGGPAFVHDLDNGRRYASSEDFYNLIKIAHMLPALHAIGAPCEFLEAPIPERHLHTIFAQLYYSDKAIHGSSRSAIAANDTLNMIRIVLGDDFVENNYCLFGGINTNSPLVLDETMLAAAKTYARANQPVLVSGYILAGAMGPMGLAGALAQQLAETMASLALLQIFRPGVPCLMGTFIGAVSMKNGSPVYGTPESLLGIPVAAELARRLGVPSSCAGGAVTASKVPDAQAACESALMLQSTFLAGVNYVSHAAGWLEGG
ncbi:MAG: trimethylamine methyltransferase, partial [Rhodospirillales bacterium]|nr:trimethylamine methyltransferase [Rhodospirillales bacterium]